MWIRSQIKRIAQKISYVRFKKIIGTRKKCVLISHELSLTGAPIALYRLAVILRSLGYDPIIISKSDGPIAKLFRDDDFEVIITYGSKEVTEVIRKEQVDFVLFNTIVAIDWVEELQDCHQKMVWWIHEGRVYISKYVERFKKLNLKNVKIWYVSNWVKSEMLDAGIIPNNYSFCSFWVDNEFISKENEIKALLQKKDIKTFSVGLVGTITERKNQMELIDAYLTIPESIRKNITIRLLGSGQGEYFERVKNLCEQNKGIILVPPVEPDKVYQEYLRCDLWVCTSFDDPGPMSAAEIMMYKRRIICSNNTGMYYFLKEIDNKCVYQLGDINELANKIQLAYLEKENTMILEKEYQLYLKVSPSRKNGQEKCEKSRMKQTGANESKVKRQKLHTAAFQNRRAISIQSKSEDELCCRKLQYKQRYRSVPPAWSGSGADEPAHISDS